MKLTKKQINEIRELREQGEKVQDIADKFNVSKFTINYWTNEESRLKKCKKCIQRFKNLPFSERQKIYKQRLPYLTNYQRKRYHEDEEFREKEKKRSKEYYKRKKNNEKQ